MSTENEENNSEIKNKKNKQTLKALNIIHQ